MSEDTEQEQMCELNRKLQGANTPHMTNYRCYNLQRLPEHIACRQKTLQMSLKHLRHNDIYRCHLNASNADYCQMLQFTDVP